MNDYIEKAKIYKNLDKKNQSLSKNKNNNKNTNKQLSNH